MLCSYLLSLARLPGLAKLEDMLSIDQSQWFVSLSRWGSRMAYVQDGLSSRDPNWAVLTIKLHGQTEPQTQVCRWAKFPVVIFIQMMMPEGTQSAKSCVLVVVSPIPLSTSDWFPSDPCDAISIWATCLRMLGKLGIYFNSPFLIGESLGPVRFFSVVLYWSEGKVISVPLFLCSLFSWFLCSMEVFCLTFGF